MSQSPIPNRCRIVLITPKIDDPRAFAKALPGILAAGDVASLIVPQYDQDDATFQRLLEAVTPIAQDAGAAVIVAGETRIAARVGADGVHIEGSRAVLDDAIDRLQDKMAVGAGGAKTRDDALDLGEARPDYIFFGRFGYDNKPEPHPRNLTLGEWWADIIEVPCIVMAGTDIGSVQAVAETGVEFVALSAAVFSSADPAKALAEANALLDAHAPQFSGAA